MIQDKCSTQDQKYFELEWSEYRMQYSTILKREVHYVDPQDKDTTGTVDPLFMATVVRQRPTLGTSDLNCFWFVCRIQWFGIFFCWLTGWVERKVSVLCASQGCCRTSQVIRQILQSWTLRLVLEVLKKVCFCWLNGVNKVLAFAWFPNIPIIRRRK